MKIREIVQALNLQVLTCADKIEQEIVDGYMSDVLADVLAHAAKNSLWITHLTHENVIATAFFKQLVVLLPENLILSDDCLQKAADKKILILQSDLAAFPLAGKLYNLGIGTSA